MGLRHARSNLLHQRQHNQRRDGMADEGGDDQDEGGEHDEHAVQTHALHALGDRSRDGMQQAGRADCFPEGQPTGGEDDDGPEEVVKVLFGEDAGAEEEDDGDDGHDAHVAEDAFELMGHAPQDDGADGDAADEPLDTGELVLHGPDGDDVGAFARLEG